MVDRLTRIGVVAALLALGGCKDYGKCLASHVEPYTWMMPIQTGSVSCGNGCSMPIYVYVPIDDKRTVCDRWEFPEGKP
ncbi:MAG: hypothetical protein ACOY3N_23330 [Bradyrhizobium sp.]|uniref:hypothetical protein n=1 Tax=Bradyrhizobium sp. TaxID=376 RepID=UPI003BF1744F